jgi:Arc/MetJ-type ribon-helix-helix transcriptional regulator
MKLTTILLPKAYFEKLDILVEHGLYPSRSEAIRTAVNDLIKTEVIESVAESQIPR